MTGGNSPRLCEEDPGTPTRIFAICRKVAFHGAIVGWRQEANSLWTTTKVDASSSAPAENPMSPQDFPVGVATKNGKCLARDGEPVFDRELESQHDTRKSARDWSMNSQNGWV